MVALDPRMLPAGAGAGGSRPSTAASSSTAHWQAAGRKPVWRAKDLATLSRTVAESMPRAT